MISAIRNKFGNKIVDIFIWLAIITFVGVYFLPAGQSGKQNEQWALSVNNETLPYIEYQQILDNYRKDAGVSDATGKSKEENYKKAAIEALTNMLLIQSLESDLNIVIKPELVRAKLQKMLPGLVSQDGSIYLEQLKAKLGEANLAQFVDQLPMIEKQVAKELKHEIINNILLGSFYLPEFVISNYYNDEFALKQFAILTAPYNKYYNEHKVDDAQLKSFFDQANQLNKKYWNPELRSGTVWTFSPSDFGIKVTDKQIKNYYDRYRREEFVKQQPKVQVRRILIAVDKDKSARLANPANDQELNKLEAARDKAGKIRAELANDPSKFAELAKQHSDDKSSAHKGGLLDFFGENEREQALVNATFELSADGDISEIFETSEGIEIIQRVAKQKIEFKSLEEVKSLIEQKVIAQQFEKLFPINARRVITDLAKNKESLANFVQAKKGVKKTLLNASQAQAGNEVAKLFELKKAGLQAVITGPKLGQIVVLDNIVATMSMDFNKIKTQVLADYQKSEAIKAIKKQLVLAMNGLQSGKTAKDVASEFGLDYELTPMIAKSNVDKIKKDVPVELLWSLRTLGATKFTVSEQADRPNGYLVKMEQLQQPTATELKDKRALAKGSLFNKYRQGLDSSFIASLRKNGTIKVNTAIINI